MQKLDIAALTGEIKAIVHKEGNSKTSLVNVVRQVQSAYGQVSDEMVDIIAKELSIERIEVEGCAFILPFPHLRR